MNKKVLFTLCLVLIVAFSASAQIKRIAILETLDRENKVPYAIECMVRANLTKVISSTPGYEGYDRVNISEIMDEHEFERTGLVNEDQIRKLGQIAGADYILVSEAVKYDESGESAIFITATILNVVTAKAEGSENHLMGMTPHDIQHGCESLANRLLGLPDPHIQEKTPVTDKKVGTEKPVKPEPEPVVKPAETAMEKVGKTRIGDLITFPDGTRGIVFYIGADGKGLSVSLAEGEEQWDANRRNEDISALRNFEDEYGDLVYGAGEQFSRIILSILGNQGKAAFWCNLQGNGWYLPSAGELFTLMSAFKENPMLKDVLKNYGGGEMDGWYWSSSENDRDEAWNVSDGRWISTEKKHEKNKVRAIRSFSE